MKIPIIKPCVNRYTEELLPILGEILNSNMLTNVHDYTVKFEDAIKKYLACKDTIALSSCTSGLILTFKALGISNKEIILPSFTFVATAAVASWTNNKIKYADIDDTLTIAPDDVNEKVSSKTGAILAVHMYGNPAHVKELGEIASDHGIPLIFDGAHALGAEYHEKKIGNFGMAEVFSLSPTKLLTTVEGGIVSTSNEELAEKLRILRNYGMNPDYTSKMAGINARMSEIHAAIGLVQVKDLETFISNRNDYVNLYKKELSSINGISFQRIPENHRSTHKDFSIILDPEKYGMNRDELGKKLEGSGVGVKKYFFPPMHRLKAYEDKDAKLPITDEVSNNLLSLPIHNFMHESDIKRIVDLIRG
ncbi:MAG: DegT/DnrJ/EryC1/StrS family aminotransferase [Candidatus Helarchaeota archaeon]